MKNEFYFDKVKIIIENNSAKLDPSQLREQYIKLIDYRNNFIIESDDHLKMFIDALYKTKSIEAFKEYLSNNYDIELEDPYAMEFYHMFIVDRQNKIISKRMLED